MGLEELKQEIQDSAKKKVADIKAEIASQIKQSEKQLEKELSERRKQRQAETEAEIERMGSVREAEAKAETSHLVLEKKRVLIQDAIDEAIAGIRKEKAYVMDLLKKAQKELEVSKVYCRKEDMKLIPDAVQADISGGLKAENAEGTVSVDYTYDTLMKSLREKHLQEIAKRLFA